MNYKDSKGAIERDGYCTFIEYLQEDEDEVTFYSDSMEDADKALYDASNMICFGDCSGVSVKRIVICGHEVEYAGWQPGMLYEFIDKETKETIWSCSFPRWDH